MRCLYCAKLSIESLVDLARQEFSGHLFPTTAFYSHHPAFADLAKAADDGCDLCRLVADCLKGIRWEWGVTFDFTSETWLGPDCDIETSAYAAAKALDASDVKLAINTSHIYLGETLDKASVLNALMVQVGPSELSDDEDGYAFPCLLLSLSTSPENTIRLGEFNIGRLLVDPDLSSQKNFDIARSWLRECRAYHGCFIDRRRQLPTRVVDIGPLDSPITPKVLLSGGAEADYIALSHCWGGKISSLLTSETYSLFQQGLPYHELPANFQDALIISKELGIRYIWIDSLCIVQDSKSDWEKESKKMAAIYRDATLTLSALVSEKSTAGILKQHDGQQSSAPKATGLKVFRDERQTGEVEVGWRPVGEETLRRLETGAALSERGWTLQEYVLSPRNLLFGSRQIYWRCSRCMRSADGTPEGNEFLDYKYPTASQVIYGGLSLAGGSQTNLDMATLLEDYYDLAKAYSCRRLTFGSDKLPAFSGIARSLQSVLGGQYLAGLWTTDFHYGLLWQADLSTARHVAAHRVPSWSWMVSEGPVLFEGERLRPSSYDLELLEQTVVLEDPTNSFGPLLSCCIVVKGLTSPLVRSEQAAVEASSKWDGVFGYIQYDEPATLNGATGQRYLQRARIGHSQVYCSLRDKVDYPGLELDPKQCPEQNLLLLLVQAGADCKRDGQIAAHGLVIRPVLKEGDESFERIGFIRFIDPKLEWFETWERQTILLI